VSSIAGVIVRHPICGDAGSYVLDDMTPWQTTGARTAPV
jgi:hypothetical protein